MVPNRRIKTSNAQKKHSETKKLTLSPVLHAFTVVQYATLEASAKVIGTGQNLHLHPSKNVKQFGYHFKYITTSTQGVDVQNLISVDLAT